MELAHKARKAAPTESRSSIAVFFSSLDLSNERKKSSILHVYDDLHEMLQTEGGKALGQI